jgi:hypothetical protein
MRRQRNNPTESGKRLSKEEIQAAIDKADNYLSHVGVGSDFQSKRRSWEIREQMSESTKVGGLSKLNVPLTTHHNFCVVIRMFC